MKYSIIRNVLNNHTQFDYIQKCARHINDDEFRKQVLEIGRNPMILKFESFGTKNKDKNICLFESTPGGFFFIYRKALQFLYFADRFNLTPVIKYTPDFFYFEDIRINDTNNPFKYYFEQVSETSVEEAECSYNVVKYNDQHNKLANGLCNPYNISDIYLNSMAQISKKYIKLNEYVKPIIINDIANILKDKKTIGVHVRGTDFKNNFDGHPVSITPADFIPYLENALDNNNFEQIFLATDEKTIVDYFQKKFGNKLVYYKDVFRADGDIGVFYCKSKREQHKYLLGLEVLRDMITLANCEGLIAGVSNVSICARITRLSYDMRYQYVEIIDKGINNNFNFAIRMQKRYKRKN